VPGVIFCSSNTKGGKNILLLANKESNGKIKITKARKAIKKPSYN
jgi:hypothetical protein